jgi:hypothetical protein
MDITYKVIVNTLLDIFEANVLINSVGYGDEEDLDVSKEGVEYTRAYVTVIDSDMHSATFTVFVLDKVNSDLSNRLDVQSNTLTISREIVQSLIAYGLLSYDDEITFEPTKLYGGDTAEGWSFDLEVKYPQMIDVCVQIANNPINNNN